MLVILQFPGTETEQMSSLVLEITAAGVRGQASETSHVEIRDLVTQCLMGAPS